jgi:hypothetical protein
MKCTQRHFDHTSANLTLRVIRNLAREMRKCAPYFKLFFAGVYKRSHNTCVLPHAPRCEYVCTNVVPANVVDVHHVHMWSPVPCSCGRSSVKRKLMAFGCMPAHLPALGTIYSVRHKQISLSLIPLPNELRVELKVFSLRPKLAGNILQNISPFASGSQAIFYKTFRPFALRSDISRDSAPKAPKRRT